MARFVQSRAAVDHRDRRAADGAVCLHSLTRFCRSTLYRSVSGQRGIFAESYMFPVDGIASEYMHHVTSGAGSFSSRSFHRTLRTGEFAILG